MYTNKINNKLIKYRKLIQNNLINQNKLSFISNVSSLNSSTIMINFKDICESIKENMNIDHTPFTDVEEISKILYNFLKNLNILYGNPNNEIDIIRYKNFTKELKILTLEIIAPKIIINKWKFSKDQLIQVIDQIKNNINRNIINYHEPLGIKVSQTSGETFTQAALKSIHSKKTIVSLKTLEEKSGYVRIKEILELKNIEFAVIYINMFDVFNKTKHEECINKMLEVYISDLLVSKFSCDIIENMPFNKFKQYFEFIPNINHEVIIKKENLVEDSNDQFKYLKDNKLKILPWMILIKLNVKLMLFYNILLSEIAFMIEDFYEQKNSLFIKFILSNGFDEILICFDNEKMSNTLKYDIESVKSNILAKSIYSKTDTEYDFRNFIPIKIKGLANYRNTNLLEISNNTYKSEDGSLKNNESYKIITNGVDMYQLLNLSNEIDINNCFMSNMNFMNKHFGILSAKETCVWELKKAYNTSDLKDFLDKQLILMANFMTANGYFVSISRNTYNLVEGMPAIQKVTFENIKDFFKTETLHARIESADSTFGCSLFGNRQVFGSNSGIVMDIPEDNNMTIGDMLE